MTQGLVHSEKGAKMLEKLGASVGDSESIKISNAKLRAIGMPAEDEDPVSRDALEGIHVRGVRGA